MAYKEPGTSNGSGGTPVEYDPGNPLKKAGGTPVVYTPPAAAQDASGGGGGRAQNWMANYVKMRMAQQNAAQQRVAQQATAQQPNGQPSLTLGINKPAGGPQPIYPPGSIRPAPTPNLAAQKDYLNQSNNYNGQNLPAAQTGYQRPPNVPGPLLSSSAVEGQVQRASQGPGMLPNENATNKAAIQAFAQGQERNAQFAKNTAAKAEFYKQQENEVYNWWNQHNVPPAPITPPKRVGTTGTGGYSSWGYGGWGGYGGYGGYGSYSGSSPSWFTSLFTWKI